jgi:hypothetical protein
MEINNLPALAAFLDGTAVTDGSQTSNQAAIAAALLLGGRLLLVLHGLRGAVLALGRAVALGRTVALIRWSVTVPSDRINDEFSALVELATRDGENGNTCNGR